MKLINSPDTVVTDALAGIAAAHPSLSVDIENKVVTRASAPTAGKVGPVSGGVLNFHLPLAGDLLVMVNGMGGTSLIELYGAYHEVSDYIAGRSARIVRNLVGNYITSLEMQGFSVTVCRLTDTLAALWDAPVETPGLRWGR